MKFLSDHIEINFNHFILMVFLSAIIVALDLWHSFLARLNPEDQKEKTQFFRLARVLYLPSFGSMDS